MASPTKNTAGIDPHDQWRVVRLESPKLWGDFGCQDTTDTAISRALKAYQSCSVIVDSLYFRD